MILIFFTFFIFTPINVVFIYGLRKNDYTYKTYGIVEFTLDFFFLSDIIINFFTGFIEKKTDRIVLKNRSIAVRYLRGMFWVDLLTSIPWNLFVRTPLNPTKEETDATLYDCIYSDTYFDSCLIDFLDIVQLIKFVRFPTLLTYVDNFTKRFNLRFFYMKIFKVTPLV